MTLAEQKAVVAHTSEAFSDTEPNVVTEAAKAVLKDSEARGGVQMLGVDKIYPGSTVKALDDFNLEINPGEMVVLLGGSGCGKSTALRSLAGLEDIQAGRILVGGQDVTGVPVNKRDMAMVFPALKSEAWTVRNAAARPWRNWNWSDLPTRRKSTRSRCPAASSSAWPWPVRWP